MFSSLVSSGTVNSALQFIFVSTGDQIGGMKVSNSHISKLFQVKKCFAIRNLRDEKRIPRNYNRFVHACLHLDTYRLALTVKRLEKKTLFPRKI